MTVDGDFGVPGTDRPTKITTDTAPDLSEIKVRGLIPQTVLQGTARERPQALIKALLGAPATPPTVGRKLASVCQDRPEIASGAGLRHAWLAEQGLLSMKTLWAELAHVR